MAAVIRTSLLLPVRRTLAVAALCLGASGLLAASAEAHSLAVQAKCGSVTIDWTRFADQGAGNNGLNSPTWSVAFTPTGGATINLGGSVSFPGSSYSLTVALPAANGTVTVSSVWTGAQTRDGFSGSASRTVVITNCAPATPPPTTPPPTTPPPSGPPADSAAPLANVVAAQSPTPAPVSAQGACVASPSSRTLKGVSEKARTQIRPYISAAGVKSVTFYLDGHRIKTVNHASRGRFTTTIRVWRLRFGAHRVSARVTLSDATCARAAAARNFIRVKSAAIRPLFTG